MPNQNPLKHLRLGLLGVIVSLAVTGAFAGRSSFEHGGKFKPEDLGEHTALCGMQFYLLTVFGPTGMNGYLLDNIMVVKEVDVGSPAEGQVHPNDMILAVSGKPLGEDPLKDFGEAIEPSEAAGEMVLSIRRNRKEITVTLPLRKLGAFGRHYPFDCAKSRQIHRDACEYLVREQNINGTFESKCYLGWGLNGLTWLASGEDKYLENCRRLAHGYRDEFDPDAGGTENWGWGYMAVFLAEYYLKTGDASVLPLCHSLTKAIERGQYPAGGWGHGPKINPGYTQGGMLNNAGLACFMGLILMREAGVRVDEHKFQKAYDFFSRFAFRGAVPYGDHRPGGGAGSNGKQGAAGICFSLLGEEDKAQWFASTVTDGYRSMHAGHTGGFMGFWLGSIHGAKTPHYPDFRRQAEHWKWLYNLSRRWDGGFLVPLSVIGKTYTMRGPILSTGGLSISFAMPDKELRIFGAPKSVLSRRNHSPEIRKALSLLIDCEFGKIEALLKDNRSVEARSLLDIAARKKRDIDLSIARAEHHLVNGNPNLAGRILKDLEHYTAGKSRSMIGNMQWRLGHTLKSTGIGAAAGEYDYYKWLTFTDLDARQAFERLAANDQLGVYQQLARRELATSPDAAFWSYYCQQIHFERTSGWQRDKRAFAAKLRVAGIHGGAWPRVVAMNDLQGTGKLGERYKEWTCLFASPNVKFPNPRGKWSVYLAVSKKTYEAFTKRKKKMTTFPTFSGLAPEGNAWMLPDFDDSKWVTFDGPMKKKFPQRAAARGLKDTRPGFVPDFPNLPGECLIRIAFNLQKTQFDQLRLGVRIKRPAVGYLNGTLVLWTFPTIGPRMGTSALTMVPMNTSVCGPLRKGKNVFAVRTSEKSLDFALYGNNGKDPLAWKPRPKDWLMVPAMAVPGTDKTRAYEPFKSLLQPCSTGLALNPEGKPNPPMNDLIQSFDGRDLKDMINAVQRGAPLPEARIPIEERAKYLGHPNVSVRTVAARSLLNDGARALPHVREALKSDDVRVIAAACMALYSGYRMNGRTEHGRKLMTPELVDQALPELLPLLDHEDLYVRYQALMAMSSCGKGIVPHYAKIAAMAEEEDWWIREGVAHVFNYTRQPEAFAYARMVVNNYIHEPSTFGRNRQRESLVSLGRQSPEPGTVIAEALGKLDNDGAPNMGALNILGQIGPNAKDAIPLLDAWIEKCKRELPSIKLEIDRKNHEYFIRRMTEIKATLNPEPKPAGGGKTGPKKRRK
ncbi:MAG: DUF6288 domain-containing protein [Kiritimatiellia bacterium]|nr:DUF6288 domain-containing protein [Kiritimatiellia bacterium]